MFNSISIWQRLAFVAMASLIFACQQSAKPMPPVVASPQPLPAPAPEIDYTPNILPFPAHFTLARRDLLEFAGTVNLGDGRNEVDSLQGLRFSPVLSSRFGCYTLGPTDKWGGGYSKNCLYEDVFDGFETFAFGEFVFAPCYDESAFHGPVISVWKIRGDSLYFYAILDKWFHPDEEGSVGKEGAGMQIDSVLPVSSKKRRVFGRISWPGGSSGQLVVKTWSGVWTLPDKLELR